MICLPQRVVLGSQELLHERDRFQDPRFAVLLEHQKVFITTDQEVDLGCLGECKQVVIFRIAADLWQRKLQHYTFCDQAVVREEWPCFITR